MVLRTALSAVAPEPPDCSGLTHPVQLPPADLPLLGRVFPECLELWGHRCPPGGFLELREVGQGLAQSWEAAVMELGRVSSAEASPGAASLAASL